MRHLHIDIELPDDEIEAAPELAKLKEHIVAIRQDFQKMSHRIVTTRGSKDKTAAKASK